MTGCLRVKPGVWFTKITPGGFRILSALDQVALTLGLELTISSACDGVHSGPDDPHPDGRAYDVRTHDHAIEEVRQILRLVMEDLSMSARDDVRPVSGGLATMYFYGVFEDASTPNAHLHFQVRKGVDYP